MKRLLLIILVVLSFPATVSGKTLITTGNVLDDRILEDGELVLTENGVRWDEEGEYDVYYYDPAAKAEIRRKVIISSTDELKRGISHLQEESSSAVSGLKANGFLPLQNGSYFLYGEICTGYAPYQTMDRYVFNYLAYFANGQKQWEQIFDPEYYGSFIDACLTENGIALIGHRDRPGMEKNVVIYEVGTDRKIKFQREFLGSADDFGLGIYYDRGNFYFFGSSSSDDADFLGSGSRDVYVGILGRDKNATIHPLPSPGRDEVLAGIYSDGKFYLVAEFDANGEKKQKLLSLDKNLNLKTYDLGVFGRNADFEIAEKNGEIIVAFRKDSEGLRVLAFDRDLNLLQNKKLDFSEPLRDFRILSGQDTYFAFLTGTGGNEALRVGRLDESGYLEEESRPHLQEIVGIRQETGGTIRICAAADSDIFLLFDFHNYRLKEYYREKENGAFLERSVLYNGRLLPKEYHEDNIPENPFGKYRIIHRFVSEDFVFYLPDECHYYARTNIRNGEVYDLGIRIYFNGEGFLNNKKITPGTAVDKAGHYLLEIRSPEETVALVFEVAELSEAETANPDEHDFLEAGGIGLKPAERKQGVLELAAQESRKNGNHLLPSLLLGALLGAVLGSLFPKIKRRKKNA